MYERQCQEEKQLVSKKIIFALHHRSLNNTHPLLRLVCEIKDSVRLDFKLSSSAKEIGATALASRSSLLYKKKEKKKLPISPCLIIFPSGPVVFSQCYEMWVISTNRDIYCSSVMKDPTKVSRRGVML